MPLLSRFLPDLTVVVAFSGGPDSVFAVEKLAEQGFKNLILSHFHHHLRIQEGDRDALFAENYAKEKGFSFVLGDWKTPEQSESKARNARYTFLEAVREKTGAQAIVTGHHADDMAETIFLQFLRGGGMRGLKGMDEWDNQRKIWRPFLSLKKEEILHFLEEKNIAFCKDSTNTESFFTRNFLRNQVFPLLEERFEGFSGRITKNTEHIVSVVSCLESLADEFFTSHPEKSFAQKQFFALHPAIRYEVLRKIFAPISVESSHIAEIEEFLQTGKSGKKWEGKGKRFQIFGENIFYESV
ncbi:MAG: tRNA lysidine(34) synthetase TilS [Candidatus Peregrinibacteria bacterium]